MQNRALIITGDSGERALLSKAASRNGFCPTVAWTMPEGIATLKDSAFDLVVLNLELSGHGGLEKALTMRSVTPQVLAYIHGLRPLSSDIPVTALLYAPPKGQVLANAMAHFRSKLPVPSPAREAWDSFIGVSAHADSTRRLIRKLATVNHPILIRGETGSGKERVARALHAGNPSRRGPLIVIDCGSISPSLIESELFGYVKGAFTGADTDRKGLLLQAEQGTVFFDEIGDLPLSNQTALLRVLQEREVRPIGSTKAINVNFRVLAATNRDLLEMVRRKEFREDLYYRLAAINVEVPPLRTRRQDVSFIAHDFMESILRRKPLSIAAHAALQSHNWPGNIRQLQNCLLRANVLADHDVIEPDDLELGAESEAPHAGTREDSERLHIERAMLESRDDKMAAARKLGIGKTTLYRRLAAYRRPLCN